VWDNEVLVYLHVPREQDLLEVAVGLEARDVRFELFREEDLGGQATALAVCDPRVAKLFRKLPLLEVAA